VLSGSRTGRDHDDQITVFDSVGFALEDFAALRFMHEAALTLGLGQRLALIPQMADPKNLFGTLLGDAQLAATEPLDCMTA
jgi:ornithine cyclodeaminase